MTILHGFLFFLASYVQIFVMCFQSRNVNSGQYVSAGVTSILIASVQVVYIKFIATSDPWITFGIASIAGPTAITSAMYVHRHLFKTPKQ